MQNKKTAWPGAHREGHENAALIDEDFNMSARLQKADPLLGTLAKTVQKQSIDDIATEINREHDLASLHANTAVAHAKRAGELLLQVKKSLRHGEFLPWAEANINVSPRQAQRYIRAALGKPIPVRAIASKEANTTRVSYLGETEKQVPALVRGEYLFASLIVGDCVWLEQIYVMPIEDGEFVHYAHTSCQMVDGKPIDGIVTYSKRGVRFDRALKFVALFGFSLSQAKIDRVSDASFPFKNIFDGSM